MRLTRREFLTHTALVALKNVRINGTVRNETVGR